MTAMTTSAAPDVPAHGPAGPSSTELPLPTARSTATTTRTVVFVLASVLAGLFAGFFWTYTISIPAGLGALDDVGYVAAFQSINATIRNAGFGLVFFGAVPIIGVLLALDLRAGHRRAARYVAAALALVLGVVVVTFAVHVPLNETLAVASPDDATAAREAFETAWNRWNLVRTVLSTASVGCLALAGSRPSQALRAGVGRTATAAAAATLTA